MRTTLPLPLKAEIIVLSDVHVHSATDERGQKLLALLDLVAKGQIDVLVMAGDIFEFMLGSSQYFRRKFDDFRQAIARVTDSGTKVVYLEGNHEFDLKCLKWPDIEVVVDKDYSWTLSNNQKVKFTHGDLVYSDQAYLRFRAIVKSKIFLLLVRCIPGFIMDFIALNSAKASRAQDQYRVLDPKKIHEAMSSWLDDSHSIGVFGHFHIPFADHTADNKGLLLSSDCWDHPSALMINSEGVFRMHYEGESKTPTVYTIPAPILK